MCISAPIQTQGQVRLNIQDSILYYDYDSIKEEHNTNLETFKSFEKLKAYASTYKILHKKSSQTCFAVDYFGTQYLVTVRHNPPFDQVKNNEAITFRLATEKGDTVINGICYTDKENGLDLIMIKCENFISENAFIYERSHSILYGQPINILGFPSNIIKQHSGPKFYNENFPYPFIKEALTSGGDVVRYETIYYLDGNMTNGYAGAPFFDFQKGRLMLLGIIIGDMNDKKVRKYTFNPTAIADNGVIKALSVYSFERIIQPPILKDQ